MKIVENLANLLKVKTLVTLIIIVVFAGLAARGDISSDNVMNVVVSVLSFYFGTVVEKKAGQQYDDK